MASQNVGQVELDLLLNSKGFQTQLEGAVNRAVSQTSKSMSGKVSGAFKAMGKLAIAAFSIKAITNFTKSSIELGSALQEVQNVVDTTFKTMNKDVDNFAKTAIKDYGLSEKTAKQYMGTLGSMATAYGFTEAEAFDMSKTLTGLTGDVASFYNLSSDEAFTKLKAVFTGETESLKELGVVMTQAALDDFALRKGFSKTTAAMTEQEKVALRYAFVQDQLKNASGDFIRTQDGWANQMRVLSLQWDSFKANIGQAFITLLTPVIKMLNILMEKLVEATKRFKEFIDVVFGKKENGTAEAMKETADSANKTETGLEGADKAAKKLKRSLIGIDQLNRLAAPDASSSLSTGGTSITPDTGAANAATEATDKASGALNIFSGKFERFKKEAIEWLTILGEGPGKFCLNFGTDIYNLLTKPLIDNKDELKKVGKTMLDDFGDLNDNYQLIYSDTWESMNKIYEDNISPLLEEMGEFTSEKLGEIASYYNTEIAPIFDEFNQQVAGVWREYGRPMLEEAEELMGSIGEAASLLWENILKPILDALLKVELVKLKIGLSVVSTTFTSLLKSAMEFSEGIMRAFKGIIDFIVGVFTLDWEKAWQGVKDTFGGIMDSMVALFATPINVIIGLINKLIDKINSVSIPDWIPFIGGKQPNIEHIGTINTPGWGKEPDIMMPDNIEMPHLANGGYVAANTPQIAMIGDNKHQGEIVAPENKLKEAVAAEIAPFMDKVTQLLEKLISANGSEQSETIHIHMDMDGDEIANKILNIQDRRVTSSGGWA